MAKKKTTKKKATKRSPAVKKTAKRAAAKDKGDLASAETPLQDLLEQPGTQQEVLKLLLSLDESQRRELFPTCQAWYRKVKKNEWVEVSPGSFSGNPLMPAARTAVFCTGNFTDIKQLGQRAIPRDETVLFDILASRQPGWIEQFVGLLLDSAHYWNDWTLCRKLVRQGLCPKPDNPHYYTGMITGLIGRWNRAERTVLDELRKDPDLLNDEIWKLFEYEGDADNTLANMDRWEDSNWSGALVTLSKEGKLSRAKLLDSALGALELGFNHYRARWFFDFFDRMQPTDQELKQRSSRIVDLIGSATPNIAQWAFEKQRAMLDRGLLEVSSHLIAVNAPLMGGRHKKTVLQTLALYDRFAQTSPKLAREVCLTMAEALSHEKADVQKAAFKLIEQHGSPTDRELKEVVERYATVAAATVKKQLQAWLASGSTDETAKPNVKKAAKPTPAIKLADLKKFDTRHIDLFNLKPLVLELEKTPSALAPIPAAAFDGTDFPRLDPKGKLLPIQDFDELLETLGRVIEDDSLVDDAERAVDGLARLHTDKPNDFDKRIGPLTKRASQLLKRSCSPFAGQGATGDLCGLILAWNRGEPVTTELKLDKWGHTRLSINGLFDEPVTTWHRDGVPLAFMSRRMLDVCQIVTSNEPRQLLSAPTHSGGWIAAETLVERINGLKTDPPESDVVLALLRLAPDDRKSALKQFKPKLKGEWLDAVKHGLGAEGIRIGKTAALWAAAARCRSPLEDDAAVAKAFPTLGPGAGNAMRFETKFRQEQTKYGPARKFEIVTGEKLPKRVPVNIPSQLFQMNRDNGTTLSFHDIGTTAGSIRWLATLWPGAYESFFATGATCLGSNLDWWEAEWHNRCFLEPLLDPDTPLLEMGAILLLCGLAAKEPGEHGLAIDICIQAIRDGRLGTDNMSRMLATGIGCGHFNLMRLAKRLHEIATISELHAYVIMHATESAIPKAELQELPRGIGDIFELLAELGTQLERGIEHSDCRSFLESLSGSNKAAKASRQLLSIETRFDPREVIASAVSHRIDRLGEWAKRK